MWRLPAHLVGLLVLAGCGGKTDLPKTHPVKGTVLDAKGKALTGGTVLFESGQPTDLSVVAQIQPDGTFTAKTFRGKDEIPGVVEGEYKVTVMRVAVDGNNNPPPPVTMPKTYKVEPKENNFEIKLPQ